MQKFLRKLNYLMWIIFNLLEKISAFAPILRLNNEAKITWRGQISNALLTTSKGTYLHRW
jgi:hypothetical protein